MPLRRGIVEVFEAIPDRIEVSGHEPTWQVTGGSFESVLTYAKEAFDDPVVLARQDRARWWPRVTLTVTKDPALAAEAPDLETLAHPEPPAPVEPEPEPVAVEEPAASTATEPHAAVREPRPAPAGAHARRVERAEPEPVESSGPEHEVSYDEPDHHEPTHHEPDHHEPTHHEPTHHEPDLHTSGEPEEQPQVTRARLEDMFAYQEEVRLATASRSFPRQRRRH